MTDLKFGQKCMFCQNKWKQHTCFLINIRYAIVLGYHLFLLKQNELSKTITERNACKVYSLNMPAKLDKKEEKKLWTFEKQKQNDKIMFNDLILKLHSSIHTECDNGKGLWVQTKQKQKVSKATKHKISRKNYTEALSLKKFMANIVFHRIVVHRPLNNISKIGLMLHPLYPHFCPKNSFFFNNNFV